MKPGLWFVLSEEERRETAAATARLMGYAKGSDWATSLIVAKQKKTKDGRPVIAFSLNDFDRLYKSVFLGPTFIFLTRDAVVFSNPISENNPDSREIRKLKNMLEYKSIVLPASLLKKKPDQCDLFFLRAKQVVNYCKGGCSGGSGYLTSDIHAYPFFTFCLGRDANNDLALNTKTGISDFNDKFALSSGHIDESGVFWDKDKNPHGGGPLFLLGKQMQPGFHWDLTLKKGNSSRIFTPKEVWQISGKQYLNIYPNMVVRNSVQKGKGGTLVWPRKNRKNTAE